MRWAAIPDRDRPCPKKNWLAAGGWRPLVQTHRDQGPVCDIFSSEVGNGARWPAPLCQSIITHKQTPNRAPKSSGRVLGVPGRS
jgi:hypothetical protein